MSASYTPDFDLSNVSFDACNEFEQKSPGWSDEGIRNTWNDRYVARKVTYPDGQMEVTVCREKHFKGPAPIIGKRTKRGESENRERNEAVAARNAKKNVRERCKSIGADRMITLTYRDNMVDREKALKDWDKFRRRVGKCVDFHYVAVIEEQQRGALHFHVAVRGRQCYQLLRSIWSSIVGLDEHGRSMSNIDVRNPSKFGFGKDGIHKLASYIAKYCGKQMECRDFDQKRYFASRGIPKPDVQRWTLASTDSLGAVQTAFVIAGSGLLNGAQFWYNKALDVIWIATAPYQGVGTLETAPF
ncbi:bacteriophage-like protein [Herbaspirillum sp. DW155]|uniref:rolling circle replication-associated protein n=1 Tax=Herbaspirillum sp. DW155 TaxID=3095609 RepID=UPI0030899389|nr:bacteriophage-like protein [Herbaspirillum sp. DW155]